MDEYLSKFDINYRQFLGICYARGQSAHPFLHFVPTANEIRERYRRGHEISKDLTHVLKDDDHVFRYVHGHRVNPIHEVFFDYDVYRMRYREGHDISDTMASILRDVDYCCRYIAGHEIGTNNMRRLDDLAYRSRFANGFEIPAERMSLVQQADRVIRYHRGGEMVPGLTDADHFIRFTNGFMSPKTNANAASHRLWTGYDPENHDYRTSFLLGYRIPNSIKLVFTQREIDIHNNLELNEACMLALAGLPFAISRNLAADFKHVTGRSHTSFANLIK